METELLWSRERCMFLPQGVDGVLSARPGLMAHLARQSVLTKVWGRGTWQGDLGSSLSLGLGACDCSSLNLFLHLQGRGG